jgi:outer membrane translocation and assembly module TamA
LRSFNRVGDATNLQELETAVREATEELRALDLHDSVFVTLDTIEGTDPKAAGGPIPVKIYLHLKEKQKMTIGTTATGSVSGREAGLEAEMAMSNYFGTAERINYKYSLDLTRSSFYEVRQALDFTYRIVEFGF